MTIDTQLIKGINEEDQLPFDMAPGFFRGVLQYLTSTNTNLPGWYTPERDKQLRIATIKNGFLSSVMNVVSLKLMGIPFKIQSKDSAVGAHLKLAEAYDDILQTSLNSALEPFINDILICDNGGFLFLEGGQPSEKPLTSMPLSLRHLDSVRCQRTGNNEWPVVYWDINNKSYAIHWSRMINVTQFPSADLEQFGVGFSFASRCFMLAQHLQDVTNYEAESLGSRSAEELIYATGARSEEIKKAFREADIESSNSGLITVGKRVYLGFRDPNAKIGKLMLKNMPDYYDKRNDVEVTLTLIALASGGQSTWFYDSVKSGSTKASAQEATKMGESKLINWWIKKFTAELQIKFCPDSLRVIGGLAEDDFDGTSSRIKLNSAQVRKLNLESKVTDIRTERELQLERNELTQTQFEHLELIDGRLENGLPIFALFQTEETSMRKLLYFIEDPLNFETINWLTDFPKLQKAILFAQGQAMNGKTILTQSNGRKALYALLWLEQQYKEYIIKHPIPDQQELLDTADLLPNLNQLAFTQDQITQPGTLVMQPQHSSTSQVENTITTDTATTTDGTVSGTSKTSSENSGIN